LVSCWYCIGEPGSQWCQFRPYTGENGYTSCTAPFGICKTDGLCPYTVTGLSGIDAAGAAVSSCSYLVPFVLDAEDDDIGRALEQIVI
jgi:hypothetical protein